MTLNRQLAFAALQLLLSFGSLHAQPAAPNYVLSLGGTNGFLELPSGAFNDLEEVIIEDWVMWSGLGGHEQLPPWPLPFADLHTALAPIV